MTVCLSMCMSGGYCTGQKRAWISRRWSIDSCMLEIELFSARAVSGPNLWAIPPAPTALCVTAKNAQDGWCVWWTSITLCRAHWLPSVSCLSLYPHNKEHSHNRCGCLREGVLAVVRSLLMFSLFFGKFNLIIFLPLLSRCGIVLHHYRLTDKWP